MINEKTPYNGVPPRILIVEDDITTARTAEALCRALGYDTACAHNGSEALALFAEQGADVVLMDLQMPLMGGFETVLELRRLEEEQQRSPAYIVAVSATVSADDYLRSMQVGMDDCASKPYSSAMMRDILEQYARCRQQPAMEEGGLTAIPAKVARL